MFRFILSLSVVGIAMHSAIAQSAVNEPLPGVKVYLDARMNETKKKTAVFFRKVDKDENGNYLAMVYFNEGELKMRGTYLDPELKVPHGNFVYYYKNGQTESSGRYENGAKIGVWERWDQNGAPKAERFYSGYKFGDEPILDPDVLPVFPGGAEAIQKYLNENLEYPEPSRINGIQGEVHVSFVINKVGLVERAMLMNSIDPHLEKEALRLIENMPAWKPGTKDGNLVNTQLAMPIAFRLD